MKNTAGLAETLLLRPPPAAPYLTLSPGRAGEEGSCPHLCSSSKGSLLPLLPGPSAHCPLFKAILCGLYFMKNGYRKDAFVLFGALSGL